jgi:hypothetical protein
MLAFLGATALGAADVHSATGKELGSISRSGASGEVVNADDAGWYRQNDAQWKKREEAPLLLAQGARKDDEAIESLRKSVADLQRLVDGLTRSVASLREQGAQLERAMNPLAQPNRFVVLGLFRYKERDGRPVERPEDLSKLSPGKRSGLPTILYNWPCNEPGSPCRRLGNARWHKGIAANKDAPEGWAWTHVGARTFSSASEADQWLKTSEDGQFIMDKAEVVMTVTVTDYSAFVDSDISTMQKGIFK